MSDVSLQIGELRLALELLLDEVERRFGVDLDLTAGAQARPGRDLAGDVAALAALPGAGAVDMARDLGHAIGVLRCLTDLAAVPETS
ncbi:MAG TPA: hypothetical protein VGC57_02190 [Cellulomonas sp.]